MSFSAETKNELARVISNDDYCNMTELDITRKYTDCRL